MRRWPKNQVALLGALLATGTWQARAAAQTPPTKAPPAPPTAAGAAGAPGATPATPPGATGTTPLPTAPARPVAPPAAPPPAPPPAAPATPPRPTAPVVAPALPPAQPSGGQGDLARRAKVRGQPFAAEPEESPELAELRRFEELMFREPALRVPGGEYKVDSLPPELQWIKALRPIDMPVRLDFRLVGYLKWFRNDPRGRAILRQWYARSGRLRTQIENALARHGLPREVAAIPMIESGFSPKATSRVGAGGVWQFMPDSGKMYGLRLDAWVDERRDWERATEAALLYFSDLYARLGSTELAMAAYNGGHVRVVESVRRYNTNDFWQLCRYEAGLPWESCNYVPKALAAAIALRNPEAFGLGDVQLEPPLRFDRARVGGSVPLSRVAVMVGTSVERIKDLNPELKQARTPPGGYELRVPVGAGKLLSQAAPQLEKEYTDYATITVRLGEDLQAISRARGVGVAMLRQINGLAETALARPGMKLMVPKAKGTDIDEEDDDDEELPAALGDEVLLVAVPERPNAPRDRERVFYRVVAGDTPRDIAVGLGVKLEDLCEWNDLDLRARMQPGMVLQAYLGKGADRSGAVLLDPKRLRVATITAPEFMELVAQQRGRRRIMYTARGGETLAKLGRRYGLTAGDLGRINRLGNNVVLQRGQEIIVYEPVSAEARAKGRARVAQADRRLRKFSRGGKRGGDRHSAGSSRGGRDRDRDRGKAKGGSGSRRRR